MYSIATKNYGHGWLSVVRAMRQTRPEWIQIPGGGEGKEGEEQEGRGPVQHTPTRGRWQCEGAVSAAWVASASWAAA